MSAQNLFQSIQAKVGNPYEKLILIILSDISNEKNQCWPSYQYLADRAECSRTTVIKGIRGLQGKGLINIEVRPKEKSKNDSNLYTIDLSPEATGRVREANPDRVREANPVGTPAVPDTLIDTKHIYSDKWVEWCDYRKEIKKTMSKSTMKMQIKFLTDYSFEKQQEIIDRSITNGWTGLFKPEEKKIRVRGKEFSPSGVPSTRTTTIRQDLEDTSWA